MNNKFLLMLLSVFLLAGCSKPVVLVNNGGQEAEPAKLISYTLDERYIYIDVVSHGCTMMSSFELRLVSQVDNSFEVVRKKPDECRMKPIKMSLNYPFRHLGLDLKRPVRVKNRVDEKLLASR